MYVYIETGKRGEVCVSVSLAFNTRMNTLTEHLSAFRRRLSPLHIHELLHLILVLCNDDIRQLKHCALVCKFWHDITVPILFRRLSVRCMPDICQYSTQPTTSTHFTATARSIRSVVEFLNDHASISIAVRHFTLTITPTRLFHRGQNIGRYHISRKDFIRLIRCMPNATNIVLRDVLLWGRVSNTWLQRNSSPIVSLAISFPWLHKEAKWQHLLHLLILLGSQTTRLSITEFGNGDNILEGAQKFAEFNQMGTNHLEVNLLEETPVNYSLRAFEALTPLQEIRSVSVNNLPIRYLAECAQLLRAHHATLEDLSISFAPVSDVDTSAYPVINITYEWATQYKDVASDLPFDVSSCGRLRRATFKMLMNIDPDISGEPLEFLLWEFMFTILHPLAGSVLRVHSITINVDIRLPSDMEIFPRFGRNSWERVGTLIKTLVRSGNISYINIRFEGEQSIYISTLSSFVANMSRKSQINENVRII